MAQPCSEQNPEAHAGGDIDDDWDVEVVLVGEYDRLAAERKRLIDEGVPADQLVEPLRPEPADG